MPVHPLVAHRLLRCTRHLDPDEGGYPVPRLGYVVELSIADDNPFPLRERTACDPCTQKDELIDHLLSGSRGHELEHAPQLVADRVALLLGQDNPRMPRCSLQEVGVQGIEIRDIEAVQDPPLLRAPAQLVGIRASTHPVVTRRAHIDAAHAKGIDKVIVHRIFVDVETWTCHDPRDACSAASFSYSASSEAMSCSISARLA